MTARIVRPLRGRIEVRGLRGPRGDEPANREMFRDAAGAAIRPEWIPAPDGEPGYLGYWTLARTHLTVVAETIALRDGAVDIEMHYSTLERCDDRCQHAQGDDCTCTCEGAHHGEARHARWKQVGDTLLVRSGEQKTVLRRLWRQDVTS